MPGTRSSRHRNICEDNGGGGNPEPSQADAILRI
jgi:hypothetical protein